MHLQELAPCYETAKDLHSDRVILVGYIRQLKRIPHTLYLLFP